MASTYGKVGSFNRTIGVRIDMDEAITILPVDDVPLQRWLPSQETSSIKVEWMEETLTAQSDTVSAVVGAALPQTVTVSDVSVFRPNDILHTQDAAPATQFLVNSVNTAANTMVLTGFGGSVVIVSNADILEIVGQYLVEGADPQEARTQERTGKYNYTQIGQEKVEASRTARKRAMFAQVDPYDHEVQKKFRELAIRFERMLVLGQRSISTDNTQRALGGLFYNITTNTRSGVVANAKALVNSLVRDCWTAGGSPTTLMCSPAVKAAISTNVDPTLRRFDVSAVIAGYVVEKITTDFGTIEIVPNRYFPKTKGLLLQREYDIKRVFDGYHHELLAKTGDSDKGEIVGEFSLEVKNEKAQGILTLTDAT